MSSPHPAPTDEALWDPAEVADALHALAARAGIAEDRPAPPRPSRVADGDWIDAVADALDVEAEPVDADFAHLDGLLKGGGPALIRCDGGVMALIRARGRRVWLLGPDRRLHRRKRVDVARTLRSRVIEMVAPGLAGVIDGIAPGRRRRARVESALLSYAFHDAPVGRAWLLRASPGAAIGPQVREAGLLRQGAIFVGARLMNAALALGGWWLVGDGALDGHLGWAALFAWMLTLVSMVPLSMRADWARARLSVGVGVLLKKRLLLGALRIDPDAMRHRGAGGLMAQVFEGDAIEAMALGTAVGGLMSVIELIIAGSVLAIGAGGGMHVVALLGFAVLVTALTVMSYRRQRRWTDSRLELTSDLIERMVGDRTRRIQTRPRDWHRDEDRALCAYLGDARRLDAMAVPLALLGRGWLIVGLAALAPAFVAGASAGAIAVSIGGILLASGALTKLGNSLGRVSSAVIAWKAVSPLYRAAAQREPAGDPAVVARRAVSGQNLLDARGITFRHRPDGRPVLDDCALRMDRGQRVLLEGPSGGGKSTLASVVTGLRRPQQGLVMLGGYDRQTLGTTGWRRRVAAAPQFGENHVFSGTLAFNLLLGRAWPPSAADMQAAEQMCNDLGLGPLIERMPAGLQQQVGETGWQLSHGEQSRLFLARALLQETELVVLDESFAALDPITVDACLRTAIERAPSLMVIAHP